MDAKDIDPFMKELEQTEEWLYEDGSDCPKNEYVKRINILKEKGIVFVLHDSFSN